MPKFHVHVYAIVRVKVWNVEAESQQAAIDIAYDAASEQVLSQLPDRTSYEPPGDGMEAQFAGWAEDIESFLVDEDGDTEYRNSRHYNRMGKPYTEPEAA